MAWENSVISAGSIPAAAQAFSIPVITPSLWSAVEGTFAVTSASDSVTSVTSVNVPPTSTPTRGVIRVPDAGGVHRRPARVGCSVVASGTV